MSSRSSDKIIIILNFRVGTPKNKGTYHRGKETCAIFGLPVHNKNCAMNVLLPFFFDFNIMETVYSETSL